MTDTPLTAALTTEQLAESLGYTVERYKYAAPVWDPWRWNGATCVIINGTDKWITRAGFEEIAALTERAEKAEARVAELEAALGGIVQAMDSHHSKYKDGPFTFTRHEIELARAALEGTR